MKLLIFTPIFKPEKKLKSHLHKRFSTSVEQVIYLNSPYQLPDNSKTIVLGDGSVNSGISKPFNEAMRYARDNNFDYVLFLDQDTIIDLEVLMGLLSDYIENKDAEKTAIFFLRASNESIRPYGELLTNSGSLFHVRIFEKLGGFNQQYFLDGLDYEFCLRVWRGGFQIINLPLQNHFDHTTLQDGVTKRFFGRELNIRRYSSSRYNEMSIAFRDILLDILTNREWVLLSKFIKSYVAFQLGKLIAKVSK